MFTRAILRRPGPDFAAGITTAGLGLPDLARMTAQHEAYADALRALGLEVQVLDALPGFPDAYFVEDVAVVVPEVAIVTRPGAPPRSGETEAIVPALARHRRIARLHPPAKLDGGDVLVVGRTVFAGLSERSNEEGVRQLSTLLQPHGYRTVPVPVTRGLHLKSSVNAIGDDALLVAERYRGRAEFAGFRQIAVEEAEEPACNTLLVNGTLLTPAGFPRTRRALEAIGVPVIELDVSEARKMDGGLTCMSLRLQASFDPARSGFNTSRIVQ